MGNAEILGMDQLLAQLQQLGAQGEKIGKDAVQAGADVVKEVMEENVNRSSKKQPHVQDNVDIKLQKKDGEYQANIGPNKEVGYRVHFLEFGTTKMDARPFIEISLTENTDKINRVMSDVIRDRLGL
ncbi:HK97-gp10 family putative phage morphogenesis protein [Bacillus pseudomycoides]|uniref:HK97-gp10 family putative phage morphogenesis protein n=1 Tax=Bacillus pseudomycoides TaxID=64104 RepID=UPI002FFFF951